MNPSEILSFYCSKTVVVSAKTQKSPEVTKNKAPGRPKLSSMFLRKEAEVINSLSNSFYGVLPSMSTHDKLYENLE